MKNLEQFIADVKSDEELRKKFHESLNKLRADKTLSVYEAGIKILRELGYEISDDESKTFIKLLRNRGNQGKTQLSDDELDDAAGGHKYCTGLCGCGRECSCFVTKW